MRCIIPPEDPGEFRLGANGVKEQFMHCAGKKPVRRRLFEFCLYVDTTGSTGPDRSRR